MNILLLSVGTRNKIVQYFKKTTNGKVVVTDMQEIAPAVYEADAHYKVPRMTEPGYIDVILEICKKEDINAVMTLIDPELSLLAENERRFAEAGVTVVGSPYDLCEMSLDKMQMYKWLNTHNYNCAKSYDDKAEFYEDLKNGRISFPVFVKPVRGSASVAISKVNNEDTLEALWDNEQGLMIQEYLNGQEIGVDCYIDLISGELVSVFAKKKLLMRAGETDKAVSFKDDRLFELVERFVAEAGYRGQIDIDVFEINGQYYISEVNPRFGGGYPHAYECGCDHMKLIENNINGITNEKRIGVYEEGVYMMKYNEVCIKRGLEL